MVIVMQISYISFAVENNKTVLPEGFHVVFKVKVDLKCCVQNIDVFAFNPFYCLFSFIFHKLLRERLYLQDHVRIMCQAEVIFLFGLPFTHHALLFGPHLPWKCGKRSETRNSSNSP